MTNLTLLAALFKGTPQQIIYLSLSSSCPVSSILVCHTNTLQHSVSKLPTLSCPSDLLIFFLSILVRPSENLSIFTCVNSSSSSCLFVFYSCCCHSVTSHLGTHFHPLHSLLHLFCMLPIPLDG